MGLFDTLIIEEDIDLPEWSSDRENGRWQTKQIGQPMMETYKLTSDGRLLKKNETYRDRTEEELNEFTQERSEYDTWEEWEESDNDSEFLNEPLDSWKKTVDEVSWDDEEYHGTFEFHEVLKENPQSMETVDGLDFERPTDYEIFEYWSYEARFTDGQLDEIVLLDVDDLSQ